MKTKLSLAVASALLAVASSANAGVMIPAGDWTLDIGGVVNAYYTHTSFSGDSVFLAGEDTTPGVAGGNRINVNNITTGLLPNYLSVSGKTRQNDLDVGFTISINPGASTTASGFQGSQQENRQAFLTFGDASWGSIKLGKDLGIYASDAILNDMTLLGVGSAAGLLAGNTTTLGRIGNGFMYADWKAQVAYSSPNWNGFNFTVGATQAFNSFASLTGSTASAGRGGSSPAIEAKASYAWAGDFAGKVWVSGISQKVEFSNLNGANSERVSSWDLGANVNVAGFGLTGYYYDGKGIGILTQLRDGIDLSGNRRDSDGWYVQATYTLPGVGTKLGASYGESNLDRNSLASETGAGLASDFETDMWTIGAYHPITKHLNLVAEYSKVSEDLGALDGSSKTISLGAILFF